MYCCDRAWFVKWNDWYTDNIFKFKTVIKPWQIYYGHSRQFKFASNSKLTRICNLTPDVYYMCNMIQFSEFFQSVTLETNLICFCRSNTSMYQAETCVFGLLWSLCVWWWLSTYFRLFKNVQNSLTIHWQKWHSCATHDVS